MIYSWPLEVILADGTHLVGEYDSETSCSGGVMLELLFEDEGVYADFFVFGNKLKREMYIVKPAEMMAITIGAPIT